MRVPAGGRKARRVLRLEYERVRMSAETMQFRTELKQILDIIIHSLYSHKDIFLRELISNASDAIDTLRFQALTKPELADDDTNWKIKIIPDEAQGTLRLESVSRFRRFKSARISEAT